MCAIVRTRSLVRPRRHLRADYTARFNCNGQLTKNLTFTS